MCIHIERDLLLELNHWYKEGHRNVSAVRMYHSRTGEFVGSWLCFADQPQSVADAVHALRTWHPGKHHVSLDLVNAWRADLDLKQLRLDGLPNPAPLVMEGIQDDDAPGEVRRAVTAWLDAARARAYERA